MFVHTGENLPQDPQYEADLEKLGYKVDENKQIVSIEHAHHFIFFNTSSDRANEKRKEAMHTCARRLVKKELTELGVVEAFLGGEKGREILGIGAKEMPKVKYLPILITEPEELKKKRDVMIMIGDPSEDVGIWAWRHLLTSGGIKGGSAVGMVEKLATFGMDSDSGTELPTQVPGIIILNPGALLWSNTEKKTMTMFTWLARERLHALGEDYAINKVHNYIEGHSSAYEHIGTCLDHILPQILADNARLYIVGITNSAEYFLNWYQSRQLTTGSTYSDNANVPGMPFMIAAMAFMEPTHNSSSIKCEAIEKKLRECGRQWVKSEQPRGEFLTTPKPMDTPTLPSLPTVAKGSDLHVPNYGATLTEAADTIITSPAGNEDAATAALANQDGKADLEEPIVGAAPVGTSHSGTTLASLTENTHTHRLENGTNSDPGKHVLNPNSTITNGASAMQVEDINPHSGTTQPPALENTLNELASDPEEAEIDDSMTLPYDHTKRIVSCDSYSGGTDIDEMIWPNVMDDALAFFQLVARRTEHPGGWAE